MTDDKRTTTRDIDVQIHRSSILQLSNCCPNHAKNNVTKFCSQHDTVLCNECYSRAHKKCKSVVSIEKASQGVKNCAAYEDLKTRMSGLMRHFEKVLDSSKQIEINLKMDLDTIVWDLHKKREQLTKQLDFIEKSIVTVGGDGYQILDLATLTLSQRIKPSGSACRSVSCRAGRIIVHGDGNHVLHTDVQGMVKSLYEAEHNPDFIYQADDGSVYYDSWGDNSLYKLPRDGEGGAKPFFTHPDLRWPRGIAGDGQGSVFVAGESSDNIHKISFNGKIHSIILGEVDGIRRPYDLSYNRDTKQLLIVNNDCTSIDIYDMFV